MTAASASAVFTLLAPERDPTSGVLAFTSRCDRFGPFRETLGLAGADVTATTPRLMDLAAAVFAISYYKANAAPIIDARALAIGPAGRALVTALYTDGLGEFFVRNARPFPPDLEILWSDTAPEPTTVAMADGRPPVVAFGGGKDSHVAARLIEARAGAVELASVCLSSRTAARLSSFSHAPVTVLDRRLDPALLEANANGALNGHVPITAVNTLALTLYAAAVGAPAVVFANERSADEPTATRDGRAINHQYSKSFEAERLMQAAIHEAIGPAPAVFSALRPYSEVAIARALSSDARALTRFSSCNRNFVFAGPNALPDGVRWCGECAKCVFTTVMLAPWMSREAVRQAMGVDALGRASAVPMLRATLGLEADKPWDCTGSVMETRAALHRAAQSPDWAGAAAIAGVLEAVHAASPPAELDAAWAEALAPSARHAIPAPYRPADVPEPV